MNHLFRKIFGVSAFLGILFMPFAFAYASGTATIQNLSPGETINVGKPISFSISTSGFTNPQFQLSDSFPNTSVGASNINYYSGAFLWTPIGSDVGTHTITIHIQDSLGDSVNVSQQIIVHPSNAPALSLLDLSPSASIQAGQQIEFFAEPLNYSESNVSYFVNDSFSGSSVNSSDILPTGEFQWTPTQNDVGTHIITITGQDPAGDNSSAQIQVTVSSVSGTSVSTATTATSTATSTSAAQTTVANNSSITLSGVISGSTVAVGSPLSFAVTSSSLTNPTYTISDTFGGSTIANADITSAGQFMWTPVASDVGTHTLTITGTDSLGHTSSATVSVVVVASSTTIADAVTTTSTPANGAASGASASAVTANEFTTTLSLAAQGTEVTALQNYLTQAGLYTGPITGYYGLLTKAAVMKFQTTHGITAIGIVGPQTLAALQEAAAAASNTSGSVVTSSSASSTTAVTTTSVTASSSSSTYVFTGFIEVGSKGAEVTALQQKLTALGMYSGPITGYYGSLTETAVREFQTAHSIPIVGTVGPETRAALNQ